MTVWVTPETKEYNSESASYDSSSLFFDSQKNTWSSTNSVDLTWESADNFEYDNSDKTYNEGVYNGKAEVSWSTTSEVDVTWLTPEPNEYDSSLVEFNKTTMFFDGKPKTVWGIVDPYILTDGFGFDIMDGQGNIILARY